MDVKIYEMIVDEHIERFREIKKNSVKNGYCKFLDVGGNLVGIAYSLYSQKLVLPQPEEKRVAIINKLSHITNSLSIYFSLIERHHDFAKAEFEHEHGYFPEFKKSLVVSGSPSQAYVHFARKRLENRISALSQ